MRYTQFRTAVGVFFLLLMAVPLKAQTFSLEPIPPQITAIRGMNDLGSVVGEDTVTGPVVRYWVWRRTTGIQELGEPVHAISNAEEITTQFSTSVDLPVTECGFSGCHLLGTATINLPQTRVGGIEYSDFGVSVVPPPTASAHQVLGHIYFITTYEDVDENVTTIYPTTDSLDLAFANGAVVAPPPAVPFPHETFVRGYNGSQLLWDGDHSTPDFMSVRTSLYLQDGGSGGVTDVGQQVANQVAGVDPKLVAGLQVTDDGDVLVYYQLNGQQYSALWHPDGPLEQLGDATFQPLRVNQLRWGISPGGTGSLFWDGTQVVDVSTLLDTASADWDITSLVLMNNSGQIVAEANQNGGPPQHVLLTPDFITRWANAVDGDWEVGTNWEGGAAPESNEFAVFDADGAYTTTLNGHTTVRGLQLLAGDVTFDLSQGALTVTDSITTNGAIRFVGDGGIVVSSVAAFGGAGEVGTNEVGDNPSCGSNGTVCLPSPWLISSSGGLFDSANGHTNELVVDGDTDFINTAGRAWFELRDSATLTTNRLVIGDLQGGYFDLANGAQLVSRTAILGDDHNLFSPDGNGVLENNNSFWAVNESLTIGNGGVGRVTIGSGGVLEVGAEFKVGVSESSSGTLRIDGGIDNMRSRVTFRNFEVSVSGSGSEPGDGQVMVTGGGELVVHPGTGRGKITVGKRGTLDISSSDAEHPSYVGTLDSTADPVELVIDWAVIPLLPARFSSETARVNVGEGGFLQVNEMTIGMVGNGELNVVSSDPSISGFAWITRKLFVGSLTTRGEVIVDAGGKVFIGPNAAPERGVFRVGPGGVLAGSGTITAPRVVTQGGDVSDFDGAFVMVGNSAGRMIIDGDFHMEGGVLELEIGGTEPADFATEGVEASGLVAGLHDVLEVTGDAEFFGTVILKFIDGFAPQQGQTFDLIDVGGTVNFAPTLVVQGLRPGFEYMVTPDAAGMIVLTALNDGVFVPEPCSLVLILVASVGLVTNSRWRIVYPSIPAIFVTALGK